MTQTYNVAVAFALAFSAGLGAVSAADAQTFEVETGIEMLQSPNTTIEGLHRLYIGRRVSPNFSVGQGIYSAAAGDAGGAFFWGFEGVAHLPLSSRVGLSFSGFAGGGGGAAQVNGDGTMLRAGIALDYQLSRDWDVQLTTSWIRISGAPIDGPAYGLGLRYRFGDRTTPGWAPEFDAITLGATYMQAASGTRTRSGGAQPAIALVGAQAMFDVSERTQLSFGAAGAAGGAQGYMQIMAGVRQRFALNSLSFFAEGGLGFGGGGDVDTGNGVLLRAALGISVPVSRAFDLELAVGAQGAASGDYRASTVALNLTRVFNRPGQPATDQRWAFSTGISVQQTHAGYFQNPANTSNAVFMQESALDYFVGQSLYVTGNAQTTVGGGAAGYAIGMMGLGYEFSLSDRWSLSVEGLLGAAGGGGVNAAGGIIGGLRAELDYRVGEAWRLSMGVGQLTALRGNGMSPTTLTLGAKIPFTTHR